MTAAAGEQVPQSGELVNFNIDAPGATSANIRMLGHTICARPMYPLDEDVAFVPAAQMYSRS